MIPEGWVGQLSVHTHEALSRANIYNLVVVQESAQRHLTSHSIVPFCCFSPNDMINCYLFLAHSDPSLLFPSGSCQSFHHRSVNITSNTKVRARDALIERLKQSIFRTCAHIYIDPYTWYVSHRKLIHLHKFFDESYFANSFVIFYLFQHVLVMSKIT